MNTEYFLATFISTFGITFNLYVKFLLFGITLFLLEWGIRKLTIPQREWMRITFLIFGGFLFIMYVIGE